MKKVGLLLAAFLIFVFFSPAYTQRTELAHLLMTVSTTLRGEVWASDLAQDMIGFRALVTKTDPYPVLGEAHRQMGIEWDLDNRSTHPPTTFLLASPVAFFAWPAASAIWGWLMLLMVIVSMRAYNYSWPGAILISILVMFWPPGGYSIGQITPIWLLGVALAYRERNASPFMSGLWIGLASLTKLFPAVFLVLFIIRRKWNALLGFSLVWLVSSLLVFLLSPDAFYRYFEVNQTNGFLTAFRLDNCAMLPILYLHFGQAGLGAGLFFLLSIFGLNWRLVLHQGEIQTEEWFLISFFSIAFLPIAWIYSLLPLLPAVLALVKARYSVRLLGLFALLAPVIGWLFGVGAPPLVLMFFIFYGLSWVILPNQRLYSTPNALPAPEAQPEPVQAGI